MRSTLLEYLTAYSQWQPDILLISRKTALEGFGKKCLLNNASFDPMEHYNHRNILDDEIVIEFDTDDHVANGKLAGYVTLKAAAEKMKYSAWTSGNKSVHVHTFFDLATYDDKKLIKRLITDWLCEGLTVAPDYQLTVRRHLIRAEFGIHEKTGKYKQCLQETTNYPKLNKVPYFIHNLYHRVQARRPVENPKSITVLCPYVQQVLSATNIKDGKQQLMYRLIHILKQSYTQEEVIAWMIRWYANNGGHKLSPRKIKDLVEYHWDRHYTITEYSFKQVLKDIGFSQ